MSVRVRLVFPEDLVREPVMARLARNFPVEPNIRQAKVEENSGWIVCELVGSAEDVDASIDWLLAEGVGVEPLNDTVEG